MRPRAALSTVERYPRAIGFGWAAARRLAAIRPGSRDPILLVAGACRGPAEKITAGQVARPAANVLSRA
jgi:hypothetical protein